MWPCLVLILGLAALGQSSHLTRLADTFIQDGVKPNFGYKNAVLYLGIQRAYELTGDIKYLDWVRSQIDGHVVLDDGSIKNWNLSRYILDEYRMGNNLLYLYDETGEDKYRAAAGVIRGMLDSYPRSPSGGFWHQMFFRNQIWLDGLFMAQPFYAQWTQRYDADNKTAWDDIFQHYNLIETHARDEASGLFVHGWAETGASWADPETGKAPNVWGRAVGWYFMSLIEVLPIFPPEHEGYELLLSYYRRLADALVNARDADSGNWWQVMEEPYPGMEGNFVESSASAMFTWGLLRGIKLEYLGDEYLDEAQDAYRSLVRNFVVEEEERLIYNTTVAECNLLDKNVGYEYYIGRKIVSNDQNGSGPFLRAAFEWETWASDEMDD